MKKVLYMAISANGYIARIDGATPWSNDEWKAFIKMVKSCGNIVIGKKTYDIMRKYDEFANIGNPLVVVVSHSDLEDKTDNMEQVKSPKQALEILQEKHFDKVLIAGGGLLNASFLNESLIDEVYLDVEPFIFAKGIELFTDVKNDVKLKLLDIQKIGEDTVQLHYQILK